ncbi:hypothetical protein [Rhodococcus sp. ARC_M6]|uniref:hypothetical protein n=1 Tax=Rhodococcus sp. ARC_M6 TaxID=2928852 RepID=UPI001FB509CF|nr:hypothetical protein [Rhodococcus sp. ARC_M6]
MKRLLTTLLIPVAILVTSCSSEASNDAPATRTASTTSSTAVVATPAAPRTEPAFLGGCSAVSVYVAQRTQTGGAPTDTAVAFLKIVENDPSYLAMPDTDKQLFREGIEAGAAGNC